MSIALLNKSVISCPECGSEIRNKKLVCKCGYIYVNRGDIFLCDNFNGIEEVLVVQNSTGNKHSPTTIVLSIFDREIDYYSMNTIDKSRLLHKIKSLTEKEMNKVSIMMLQTISGVFN